MPEKANAKIAILAGGMGTRLAEETDTRPKPMVEIGGRPLLWHIMMHYAASGFQDFAIALGYRGDFIKKYITDYCALSGNITVDLGAKEGNGIFRHGASAPEWRVDMIETGLATGTAGRVKRLEPHLGEGSFILACGDGLCTIDPDDLLATHKSHGKLATIVVVHPPSRFGHMNFHGDRVTGFEEKPQTSEGWINGGIYVFEPGVQHYIDSDSTMLEYGPLDRLAKDGELMAYRHEDFWSCVDTLRDKRRLQDMWDAGHAPWVTWENPE